MKRILLILIAIVPFNFLRIFLYRNFFSYKISYDSKIGLFNYLNFSSCEINSAKIGNFNLFDIHYFALGKKSEVRIFNRFNGFNKAVISCEAVIGRGNEFIGTASSFSPFKELENIYVGDRSLILKNNIIDLSDTINIGNDVVVGGSHSQFWTHGFDHKRTKIQGPINISNNVYIGSKSIILANVNIIEDVVVGAGTIVSKNISEKGLYTSSSLELKKNDISIKNENIITSNGYSFFRKK